MLTRNQRDLLNFIHEQIRTNGGVSPSYDEMKEHLGLASKSGVHRLVTALEERGFIRRLPDRARSIRVVRLPDGAVPFDVSDERQRVSYLVEILTTEVRDLRAQNNVLSQRLREHERAA